MTRLWDLILYCTDDAECRRTAIMGYFGEDFDRSQCGKTCDTCQNSNKKTEDVDHTEYAKQILTVVQKCKTAQEEWRIRKMHCKSNFVPALSTTSRVEKIMRGNKDKYFPEAGVNNW